MKQVVGRNTIQDTIAGNLYPCHSSIESPRRGGGHRPARGRGPDTGAGAMTRPTPRGAALVAVAVATYVAARVLGTWELYVVALAFAAMVCVSWALIVSGGRRLDVYRESPPMPRSPATCCCSRSGCGAGRRSPWLQITLHNAVGSLAGSDQPVEVESLRGRAQRSVTSGPWQARRGVHRLPAMLAVVEDPLGLVSARRPVGGGASPHRGAAPAGALLLRALRRLGNAPRRRTPAPAHARRLRVSRHPATRAG